jgi:DNA mismatch repair protein MutL
LSITSVTAGERAYKLTAGVEKRSIVPATLAGGTVVVVEDLFAEIPARRNFLKRPQAEATACRGMVVEKSLPRPDVAFTLNIDGKTVLALTGGQTFAERFSAALATDVAPVLLTELENKGCRIVVGDPSVARSDRRYIAIYANGHRIVDFSLLQAISYGMEGRFPNGTHGACLVFLTVDPGEVDFNIHPAKKEARFRNPGEVHHLVSGTVKSFFDRKAVGGVPGRYGGCAPVEGAAENRSEAEGRSAGGAPPAGFFSKNAYTGGGRGGFYRDSFSFAESAPAYAAERALADSALADDDDDGPVGGGFGGGFGGTGDRGGGGFGGGGRSGGGFRYIGRALGVFLVVEKGDALLLIDQHAAHERILFDRFMGLAGTSQALLVPYRVRCDTAEDDSYIEENLAVLGAAGFTARKSAGGGGSGGWEFTALSAFYRGTEADLQRDLLEERRAPGDLVRALAATASCRAAAKEGDFLDDGAAGELAEKALALSDPHCPHGRPIILTFTRDELYRLIRRTD